MLNILKGEKKMKYIETTQAYKWAIGLDNFSHSIKKEVFLTHPDYKHNEYNDDPCLGHIIFNDGSVVKYQKRRGKFTVVFGENYEFV